MGAVLPERVKLLAVFAASVRGLRETAGRPPIGRLAADAALSEGAVCDVLSGRRRPSRRALLAVTGALDGDRQEWGSRWDELDAAWQEVPGALWRRPTDEEPHRCKVEGCRNRARGRLSATHEWHERRYGDATTGPFKTMTHPSACTIEGCDRPYHAKGMCRPHYVQSKRAKARVDPVDSFTEAAGKSALQPQV